MEKTDAAGGHQMFGDDDMNFDLELEKFGVNMGALKIREVERCPKRVGCFGYSTDFLKKGDST
jgi:hypothetical protein